MFGRGARTAARVFPALLCLSVLGCGTVPSVRPIGRGERSLSLSSGGPITEIYGVTMPIPYASFRYRQGLSERTDIHAGIHPTMSLLGNLGIDVGMTRRIARPDGWIPSVSLEGSIYGFYHLSEASSFRAYPEFTLVGSYEKMRHGQYIYFGVQNMLQATRPYLVFVPLVGLETPLAGRFVLNIEGKWYAPMEGSDDRAVDYSYTPVDHGALGLVLGASYKF